MNAFETIRGIGKENSLGFYDIEVNQLRDIGPQIRIIDVRELDEFQGELGHIERAELVPLGSLEAASEDWPKDSPLLMVCRSGNRSGRAAQYLVKMGFVHVANLVGGMLAVSKEGEKN